MANIFTEKEERFLRELVHLNVRFMLVGLSAATIQGAPVVTQDIDIWFADINDPNIKAALKKVGGTFVPGHNQPMLVGDAVKLFDIVLNLSGLESFDRESENCIKITLGKTPVPVLKLERIIQSKRVANRPKDRLVLPVLEDALIAAQAQNAQTKKRSSPKRRVT